MTTNRISQDDLLEFVGQIIDVFEDFLEEKGVSIENPEKAEAVADGEDPDCICAIYGTDFGILSDDIRAILYSWDLVSKEA